MRGKVIYATQGGGLATKIEVQEIRPTWLVFPLAAAAFLLKSSVGSAKKFDLLGSDRARCKVDVAVKKEQGNGVSVHLNKLNLRLEV